MNKRSAQKEHTRAVILKTAHSLFAQQGFLKVNTAVIAEKAKISHGSIFAHFHSRDELISAVIERYGQAVVQRMHDLVEAGGSLQAMLSAHLQCIGENETFYSHLIGDLYGLPRQARLHVIAIQSGISHHIFRAADVEACDGKIKRIAPDLFFNTWIGLIHHYLMNRELFTTEGSIIETHSKKLVGHFINLITT